MIRRCLAAIILAVICFGCVRESQTNTTVTWKQDEDEIILYVSLTAEASADLISMLNQPATFEQISDFLVQNSGGKIPFLEGAMASAALTTGRVELKAEMEKKLSEEGLTIEIIGFKENPVKIMKGALGLTNAPKTLSGFDPHKNPDVVSRMIDLMSGHEFVVEVYGRFPDE